MGNKRLWAAMQEKEAIYAKPDMTDEEGHRLGELECVVAEEDGYSAESDAAELLRASASRRRHDGPMSELPGGCKLRVLLAQALFGKPDRCCSTSRPTTSTSTPSAGSRTFCASTRACSSPSRHDRHFLNEICTHIADIDYETIITYTGGYDDMVRQSQVAAASRPRSSD